MELHTLFFFSTCFIICSSTEYFDRKKAFEALDEELLQVEPAKRVDFLKKKVIDAEKRYPNCLAKIAAARAKKNHANEIAKKYIIPLTVRDYAVTIGQHFPDVMKNQTYEGRIYYWIDLSGWHGPEEEKAHKWYHLLEVGKNNDYIKLVIKELNRNFMIENNVQKIDKNDEKYKNYRLELCMSIARAIIYSKKLVARERGRQRKFCLVRYVFHNVTDKYMIMFYNALVKMPLPI